MIDFIIRKGTDYTENDTIVLFRTVVERFKDDYEVSPSYLNKITLVAGMCYDSEPLHQIALQLEIMRRANFDVIIIGTSMREHIEKKQCKEIREFFEEFPEYEELTGLYNSRLVFAKIPEVNEK